MEEARIGTREEDVRHLGVMSLMDTIQQSGEEPVAGKAVRPLQSVVAEIQDAVGGACRRLFILGPPCSRRLAAVRQALRPLGIRPVVIDLGFVRSRRDLDTAFRRAAVGKDFARAMLKLERQAKRQRLAVVFHNFDACFGSPGEDAVVDLVWMEAKNHCRDCKVILTARDPDFVARCFSQFQNCRGVVREITFPESDQGSVPLDPRASERQP